MSRHRSGSHPVFAACDSSPAPLKHPQCLKYYSDQHVDVKKYEKLNSWIMAMMIGVPEEDVVVGSAGAAPTSAGGGGAAAKKKKGKR